MDIVERLRMRPDREMLYIDGCVAAGYGPTVEAQAADEIECLRRERNDWQALCAATGSDLEAVRSKYELMIEENARMKLALRLIAEHKSATPVIVTLAERALDYEDEESP